MLVEDKGGIIIGWHTGGSDAYYMNEEDGKGGFITGWRNRSCMY